MHALSAISDDNLNLRLYRVIDEAIQLSKGLHRGLDHVLDLSLVGNIALDKEDALAVLASEVGLNSLALLFGACGK